ncbi:Bug family tripartite tricarboxylate transporter substrate binding protein [Diaphorobacter aerolatus]|uniref:Tripartite tricarboxylate transporter substrate binding protein n=1 Tax=Diaphorobacter aerolatus TaxID=1288495 RepID=A0A7H0GN03_9BURK|nr:tripartite tricarboxylate transporter substrate binding protein [Diaphorobacter aerolatus]QNP49669.1 tripartite tricarboxylate transporter substrate binding protein [Diaphorobacter aerolatus]
MNFRRIALAACICAAGVAAIAQDNKYPSRPIVMVSPYAAGGATETFARLLTEEFGAALGQPIVIEQKPGASGTIGARFVANSKPDGYTLLANTSGHVMYEGMYKNLSFDPMKDFKPVGVLGSAPILVVVAEGSPYKSFKQVLEAAKTRNVTFASGALGSLPHLTGERVALLSKVKMTHVPFSGNAPAVTNVLGGHVDMMYSTAASVMTQIKGHKMRALAVSTKERMPELPDVPTIAESGMPGFDVTGWYGVWAPKDTSTEVVNKVSKALVAASNRPEVRKRMADASVTPSTMTAEQFAEFAARERSIWLEVMKTAGIQPEN